MPQNVLIIPAYPEKSIKKVGIYCRVSSSKRDQLNSLTTQITALVREVARISQWELTDIFIDIAFAKTGATRREFDRMIAACESKEISMVLTKSISRFGRDTLETLEALRKIKAAGAKIIFVKEQVDTNDFDAENLIAIMEAFEQAENEGRSLNIRAGLGFAAQTGSSGLYDRKVYGYTKDEDGKLIIEPEQAHVVRSIFRWYLKGNSILGITRILQEKGILSPSGKEKWNKRTIETILSNDKYIGRVTINDSLNQGGKYRLTEHHPPIITEDVFYAAQEEKRKRSNVEYDENGAHRSSKKYSSKRKKD